MSVPLYLWLVGLISIPDIFICSMVPRPIAPMLITLIVFDYDVEGCVFVQGLAWLGTSGTLPFDTHLP